MARIPEIEFYPDPAGDTGLLCVSWTPGPHGDAISPHRGMGVGFFARNGEIRAVDFFDVNRKHDHQLLEFDNRFKNSVEITVKKGKIDVKLTSGKPSRRKIA